MSLQETVDKMAKNSLLGNGKMVELNADQVVALSVVLYAHIYFNSDHNVFIQPLHVSVVSVQCFPHKKFFKVSVKQKLLKGKCLKREMWKLGLFMIFD